MTREEWIEINWLGEPPEPWDAESEAQLPPEMQDWEALIASMSED